MEVAPRPSVSVAFRFLHVTSDNSFTFSCFELQMLRQERSTKKPIVYTRGTRIPIRVATRDFLHVKRSVIMPMEFKVQVIFSWELGYNNRSLVAHLVPAPSVSSSPACAP